MGLLLEAVDVGGPLTWRWLLQDAETRNPLADQLVRLDPKSGDVVRFRDLYGYLDQYAAPDRRTEDGARFVDLAGKWAGSELLGVAVGAAILNEAPVTVRVTVPPALDEVLLWPLELAHVGGKPLAAQGDVTFVYDIAPAATQRRKNDIGATLRILAVFSQPTETTVLALRRERYALSKLIRRIGARGRSAVELRVAQYGVTRERLAEIADDGDGWDILHLSGHGLGGAFLLEKPDGSPDVVPTAELTRLLRPVRRRVRLAVVSACESAADTTAETLRLLGLTEQAQALQSAKAEPSGQPTATAERPAPQVPGLARALVNDLDCAVVAMRYPVHDEFAIAFGDVFYEHLLSRRQPVDVAAARALAQTAGPTPSMSRPAVSLATPGVFGRAAGLTLPTPRGRLRVNTTDPKMAYFDPPYGPGEPPRFVGRAAAMARATAALAPDSGLTTVLLHGMAGSGKTTCAMELAYRNEERFGATAFWQAPTRDGEWQGALENLASRLETQLGDYGFAMTGYIGTVPALEAFLPRLRQAMEDSGVLLVLDNLETLLTPDGGWRDPRMTLLITALTSHDGESRVILTSRIVPTGLAAGTVRPPTQDDTDEGGKARPGDRTLTLPVHALSLQEAIALARELPHLRELLHADAGAVREPDAGLGLPVEAERARLAADRARVLRVLRVVQGHPKLMELADAAAADRTRLDAQLAAAEEAAYGQRLEAFFQDGTSTLDPGEFLAALTAWTVTASGALSPEARLMAEFLACLEDGDRRSDIVEANWARLWRRLERPGDDPPAPGPLLSVLARAALVEVELVGSPPTAVGEPGAAAGQNGQPGLAAYRVHPGVAAAITAQAGPAVREAADAELAAFWEALSDHAREREGEEDSDLVVRAGLAAAPYLLRRGDWDTAAFLLEQAVLRDESPGTAQAVLPSLRRIAAATGAPEDAGRLARALRGVDAREAERLLRGAVDDAAGSGDYRLASGAAGELVNMLNDEGRLAEALAVAGQKAEFTERAGLGPWSRLADQARRVQVLALMGGHARVLAEIETLQAAMADLPARADASETANPWNVRETILNTGWYSAGTTGDYQRCLDLNAEIAASKRQRGAGIHEVTRFRLNDAWPLIRLGRLGEAGRLLAECQRVFEDHADTPMLATVLSIRVDLEAALGRWQAAADLAQAALRLFYARPEPRDIANSHNDLAEYLGRLGRDGVGQRAHRLAAALIRRLSGMTHDLASTMHALAAELRGDDPAARLPATVAQVVLTAELTEGVRLGALLAALQPDPQTVEDALAEILRAAAPELPPEDPRNPHPPRTTGVIRESPS
jgi:tetratricopeptide (TPR) repeat protein